MVVVNYQAIAYHLHLIGNYRILSKMIPANGGFDTADFGIKTCMDREDFASPPPVFTDSVLYPE